MFGVDISQRGCFCDRCRDGVVDLFVMSRGRYSHLPSALKSFLSVPSTFLHLPHPIPPKKRRHPLHGRGSGCRV